MLRIGEIKYGKEIGRNKNPSHKFIWSECLDCNKREWVQIRPERPTRQRCKSCAGKAHNHSKENNPCWRGGICANIKQWHRNYRQENRERLNLNTLLRRARVLNAIGSFVSAEWEQCKKKYGYSCACCGKSEPEIKLSKDHIIPLTRNGRNSIENIQPLCLSCNKRKQIKSIKFDKKKRGQLVMIGSN